jgi:hypothetical protein
MYCQRCYADLRSAPEPWCPTCGLGFDPGDPKTFRPRPFPGKRRIILHLIATTLVGVAVAGIVALFQTAVLPSGH